MIKLAAILAAVAAVAYLVARIGAAQSARGLAQRSAPLMDPELEELIARLGRAAGAEGVETRALEMEMVNGLATPDGRVLLTTGLLRERRAGRFTAQEVASVAAHELGHLALGHHQRRMVDMSGQSALRFALIALLGRFVPFLGAILADMVARALMAGLSRRDEFEADRYATALMLKAGIGAEPQAAMLRKLARLAPGAAAAGWLASHPPVARRVEAIEANARAWERTESHP